MSLFGVRFMSSLIVLLPPANCAPHAGMELSYALVSASGILTDQGLAAIARLPKASELIVQIPAQVLSWLQVQLPKPGRGMPNAKLRAVLDGLLEDRVLHDVADMHFALPAQAPGGEATWVAACYKPWLQAWLQLLEEQGRLASRIVPQAQPQDAASIHIVGSPEDALFISSAADGVLVLPLGQIHAVPGVLLGAASVTAEPAVVALAEQALQGQRVQLLQTAQHMANALGSSWNLGQFDLSTSGGDRLLQKIRRNLRDFFFAPTWRAARIALMLVLAANVLGLNVWAWQEREQIKLKRLSLNTAVKKITGATYVSDRPIEQAQQQLTRLRQATGGLTADDFEPMLGALAESLPQQAPETRLIYESRELLLEGRPLSADALQALRSRLAEQGYSAFTAEGTLRISRADATLLKPATKPVGAPAPAISAHDAPSLTRNTGA